MVVRGELTHAQVERILQSDTFRNPDVLRRLLRFLADKSIGGEGDQLKEYSIGIDATGKPPTYDPRQDSVVRIQVGRLRHKLAEYYRSEGKNTRVLVDLPKGRFKLNFEQQPEPEEVTALAVELQEVAAPPFVALEPGVTWRRAAIGLAVALVFALGWSGYATVQWRVHEQSVAAFRSARSPELEELWKPFLSSSRPLIVSAAPLFAGFQGAGFYRELSLNSYAIRKALKNPQILPRYYYTGIGEAAAALQLGKVLAMGRPNVSMARSSQFLWQQLAGSNVLIIGAARLYRDQLRGLPVELKITLEEGGIRILHARPGEPVRLDDSYPSILASQASSVRDNGEVYALITHTRPARVGRHSMLLGEPQPRRPGRSSVVYEAGPGEGLVAKLRKPDGQLPRYYQDVMYRELHAEALAGGGL